jgi:signal transduction histidine kinase
LQLALARLDAELEHARLARDLHDGIGHALTIIGVQASAGRRSLSRDPRLAAEALDTIEGTSRQALDELDNLLGLLRREPVARTAEPDLDRLPVLVETHRSGGMRVEANVHTPLPLPRLVSTTAYRIVAEGLTNAERYAGDGPVQVSVRSDADRVMVSVISPAGPQRTADGRIGRGLTGISERVALFGGRVDAGPSASGDWVVAAVIPYGGSGG